jgi:hypothetical protein
METTVLSNRRFLVGCQTVRNVLRFLGAVRDTTVINTVNREIQYR